MYRTEILPLVVDGTFGVEIIGDCEVGFFAGVDEPIAVVPAPFVVTDVVTGVLPAVVPAPLELSVVSF